MEGREGTAVLENDTAQFTAEDIQNAAIIADMLKPKAVAEPGGFMVDRVIHPGDEDLPVPMVADSLRSAGHVQVYHTETGDCSLVNRNFLAIQLMKKLANGQRAFSLTPPATPPPVGKLLCMLHSDAPNRKEYSTYGFRSCPKCNLMTEADVEQHMRARHKREWAIIIRDRDKRERDEDRAIQRETLQSLVAVAKANAPAVPEARPRKQPKKK